MAPSKFIFSFAVFLSILLLIVLLTHNNLSSGSYLFLFFSFYSPYIFLTPYSQLWQLKFSYADYYCGWRVGRRRCISGKPLVFLVRQSRKVRLNHMYKTKIILITGMFLSICFFFVNRCFEKWKKKFTAPTDGGWQWNGTSCGECHRDLTHYTTTAEALKSLKLRDFLPTTTKMLTSGRET